MAFNKKAVTGMRDILPSEMEIRSVLQHIIRETYAGYGFTEIETPIVEHIGNLTSKQGGENEKLIFKILKRGDKLGTVDLKAVEAAGYDTTVMVVVTNTASYAKVEHVAEGDIKHGEKLIQVAN